MDFNRKTWGIMGLILFATSTVLVILLYVFFGYIAMFIGMLIFIMGGFCGRSIEKRNKIKTQKPKSEDRMGRYIFGYDKPVIGDYILAGVSLAIVIIITWLAVPYLS